MKRTPLHRTAALFAIAGVLLSQTACNTTPDTSEPPELPPEATMKMDFSAFNTPDQAKTIQLTPGFTWLYAAGNLAVWNTIIAVTLAVPVTAFGEALTHEPERQPNGAWLWAYTVEVGGLDYTAELQGAITGPDSVEWAMRISQEDGWSDVLWFTGDSDLTATAGTWTLNRNPNNPEPFIFIEWQRDPDADVASITYTNITPDGADAGSYITYARTDGETFDRTYIISSVSQDNTTTIEWNHASLAGRIMDPAHYNDDVWHCWDEDLANTDCPDEE